MGAGDNIRRIREEKGLTQARLAERAGIFQAMLCQVERGDEKPVTAGREGNSGRPGMRA